MTTIENPNILPINISKIFYFPLQEDEQFVRTGTIADGSCLIHSLFHAYSPEYTKMEEEKRIILVKKFRKELAKNLDIEEWKSINNGMVSLISFQEIFSEVFLSVYNSISSKENTKKRYIRDIINIIIVNDEIRNIYEVIFSVIKLEDLDNIISEVYQKNQDIDTIIDSIPKNIETFITNKFEGRMNEERVTYFSSKIKYMMEIIVIYSVKQSFNNYCKELEDHEVYLDQTHIEILSDKFGFDIYFLDANTRMPYLTGVSKDNYKKRNSVFILWVGECHYEIIGRIIKGSNKLDRKFDSNDPFVVMMYNLYVNPKKFAIKYPNLVCFLPKELRENVRS